MVPSEDLEQDLEEHHSESHYGVQQQKKISHQWMQCMLITAQNSTQNLTAIDERIPISDWNG